MKGVLVIPVEFRLYSILFEIDRKDFNDMMKLASKQWKRLIQF